MLFFKNFEVLRSFVELISAHGFSAVKCEIIKILSDIAEMQRIKQGEAYSDDKTISLLNSLNELLDRCV